jgi:hypothetical protein
MRPYRRNRQLGLSSTGETATEDRTFFRLGV